MMGVKVAFGFDAGALDLWPPVLFLRVWCVLPGSTVWLALFEAYVDRIAVRVCTCWMRVVRHKGEARVMRDAGIVVLRWITGRITFSIGIIRSRYECHTNLG